MSPNNPNMTTTERVLWRQVCQAAHDAARDHKAVGKAKALTKALAGSESWRLPDLRPLPCACFRAFLMMARSWAKETDLAAREALAGRLAALADAAGDILDGLPSGGDDGREPPSWTRRADLS